jgi:hypothetical protein
MKLSSVLVLVEGTSPSLPVKKGFLQGETNSKVEKDEPSLLVAAQKAQKLNKEMEIATVDVTKTHPRMFHCHLAS